MGAPGQPTGINAAAEILRGATGLKYQECKFFMKALTEGEREELLDRIDALTDEQLAPPSGTLCVVCLVPMGKSGQHCPNGCAILYRWGQKAFEVAAYYRNRIRARALMAARQ
jgi:hypothetical protein